jgi:hypothetical protein
MVGINSVWRSLRIYGECKQSDLQQVHHESDDGEKDVDEYNAGFAEEDKR